MKNFITAGLSAFLTFLIVFVLASAAKASGAFDDDVSWILPTTYVDGSALQVGDLEYTEIEISKDGVPVGSDLIPAPGVAYNFVRPSPQNFEACYRLRVKLKDTAPSTDPFSDWTNQVCKVVHGKPQKASGEAVK